MGVVLRVDASEKEKRGDKFSCLDFGDQREDDDFEDGGDTETHLHLTFNSLQGVLFKLEYLYNVPFIVILLLFM